MGEWRPLRLPSGQGTALKSCYAPSPRCLDGQHDIAKRRIMEALDDPAPDGGKPECGQADGDMRASDGRAAGGGEEGRGENGIGAIQRCPVTEKQQVSERFAQAGVGIG